MTDLYQHIDGPQPNDPRIGTYEIAADTEVAVITNDRSVRLALTWRGLALPNLGTHDYTGTWQIPVAHETYPYVTAMFHQLLEAFDAVPMVDGVKTPVGPYPTLAAAQEHAEKWAEAIRGRPCRLTLDIDKNHCFLVAYLHRCKSVPPDPEEP